MAGGGLGPGDGEGVRGPETDGRDAEVDMLTWLYSARSREADPHAQGVAGENFDVCAGHCAAGVTVDERDEAE